MTPDDEQFCKGCFAGTESAQHVEICEDPDYIFPDFVVALVPKSRRILRGHVVRRDGA